MSMLNINDLFINKNEKEKLKEKIYDDVLKQCHKKIVRAVKLNPYNNYCFYVIPKFIFGVPLYNINNCIYYLINNLTKNGFNIKYTHPNLLIITWEKQKEHKSNLLFEPKSNIKSISDYKPSGNLIYNSNQLNDLNKKKNYLLN
jgi:hypothetical protein